MKLVEWRKCNNTALKEATLHENYDFSRYQSESYRVANSLRGQFSLSPADLVLRELRMMDKLHFILNEVVLQIRLDGVNPS